MLLNNKLKLVVDPKQSKKDNKREWSLTFSCDPKYAHKRFNKDQMRKLLNISSHLNFVFKTYCGTENEMDKRNWESKSAKKWVIEWS